MAQIDIQRRERSAWPWLLLAALILVLLLLWWFVWRDPVVEPVVPVTDTAMGAAPLSDTAGAAGAAVAAGGFQAFVAERRSEFGRSHEYTAEGLRELASSLETIITTDTVGAAAVAPRIEEIRTAADGIQRETDSMRHADMVRRAMQAGAGLIADVAARRNATVDANAVSSAADSIDPQRPLLEQTDAVTRFFDAAANAVGQLGSPPS